jgi:pyruvate dehydrogenase E1 component alpha subunit
MPGKAVDGNDVLAVRAAVRIAVDLARRGGGPSLVVSDTYRYRGHSKSDRNLYRTQQEIDEWKQKDPIPRFRDWACQAGMLGRDEANKIMEQVYVEIESARKYAEDAPEPSIETIEDGVFAP